MKTRKTIFYVLMGLSLLLATSACGGEETPNPEPVEEVSLDFLVAEGHILPTRDVRLNFAAQGPVEEILVQEGESVTRDQALMSLGDRQAAEASLEAAQLELTRAEQDYDEFLHTGDLAEAQAWQDYLEAQIRRAEAERAWEDLDLDQLEDDIDEAQGEVNEREQDLEDAEEEFDIYKDLDEDNADRQDAEDDLEESREDYNEALRDLEEAQRAIDSVRANLDAALAAEEEALRDYEELEEHGHDPDQKAILESRIAAAEAQAAAAERSLENHTLRAPFVGTVTDIFLEVGQFVGPETPAVQLADLDSFMIETSDLTELEVVKISQGQQVEIVPDALPDTKLMGVVERIGESFKTQAGDIMYTVEISLEETDPDLRWGMTVELTFPKE
ncbi:MAG: HlyD family efflux transporter periplasmic adaptor subunit [Anaerolineales bacterium]